MRKRVKENERRPNGLRFLGVFEGNYTTSLPLLCYYSLFQCGSSCCVARLVSRSCRSLVSVVFRYGWSFGVEMSHFSSSVSQHLNSYWDLVCQMCLDLRSLWDTFSLTSFVHSLSHPRLGRDWTQTQGASSLVEHNCTTEVSEWYQRVNSLQSCHEDIGEALQGWESLKSF